MPRAPRLLWQDPSLALFSLLAKPTVSQQSHEHQPCISTGARWRPDQYTERTKNSLDPVSSKTHMSHKQDAKHLTHLLDETKFSYLNTRGELISVGQKEREIVCLGEADRLRGGEVNKREP